MEYIKRSIVTQSTPA